MAQSNSQAASHSSTVGANPQPNDDDTNTNTNTTTNTNTDSPDVKVYTTFEDMSLPPLLLRGIRSYGFEKPSAIQQRAIVPIIKGGDVIAQSPIGTGKTGAFCIGTLARVDFRQKALQALILSHTRELAVQTHEVLSRIGDYFAESNPNFCQTFVGGTRVQDDIKKIRSGSVVAVGTPGRVLDILKRGAFRTDMMKIMILDEADEVLSQGFQDQIYEIFSFMPRDIQVCFFSSSVPPHVVEIAKNFLREPTRILVREKSPALDGIKQFYVAAEEDHKLETLVDLYETVSIAQSVVFLNSRKKIDSVSEQLNKTNHTATSIHSDMSMSEREKVVQHFRHGHSRVLLTTDVAARVIDLHHVNIVINYDLPVKAEDYFQRVGRTGRFGRKSVVVNFVSQRDVPKLREIEQHYHTEIAELPLNYATHLSG